MAKNWLEKIKKYDAVSSKVYDEKTDTYHCSHCNAIFDGKDVIYTLDHYLPDSMGGMLNSDNLFPLCLKCNGDRKNELIDGREYYKYITPAAYEKMLNSISHQKVLKLLNKEKD